MQKRGGNQQTRCTERDDLVVAALAVGLLSAPREYWVDGHRHDGEDQGRASDG